MHFTAALASAVLLASSASAMVAPAHAGVQRRDLGQPGEDVLMKRGHAAGLAKRETAAQKKKAALALASKQKL